MVIVPVDLSEGFRKREAGICREHSVDGCFRGINISQISMRGSDKKPVLRRRFKDLTFYAKCILISLKHEVAC